MLDAMPEPKPEALEGQSASALPEGADPDPDQYLWGV